MYHGRNSKVQKRIAQYLSGQKLLKISNFRLESFEIKDESTWRDRDLTLAYIIFLLLNTNSVEVIFP